MKPLRTLIGPVLIAALAITGVTAAQARAETSDLAKFLIGIAAFAAIASAIDNDANTQVSTTQTQDNYHGVRRYDHNKRYKQRYALPARCLRFFRTPRGDQRLFSARCLERKTERLAKLPKDCRRTVLTRQGRKWALAPRCLRRAGFYIVYPRDRSYAGDRNYRDYRSGTHIVWGN